MRNNFSFYKIGFVFIWVMILTQSCTTEKSGPHATAVIQFAAKKQVSDSSFSFNENFSDSDFVALLNSTGLVYSTLKKIRSNAGEESLEKAKNDLVIKRMENSGSVILKFYTDDPEFSVNFLEVLIKSLSEEITLRQKRSVNKQISFLDSIIERSANELSSMQNEVERMHEKFKAGFPGPKKVNSPNLEKYKKINTEILLCATDGKIMNNMKVMIEKKEFDNIKFLSEMVTDKDPSFDKLIDGIVQLQNKITLVLQTTSHGQKLDSLRKNMKGEQQKLIAFLDNEKKKYEKKKEWLQKELAAIPPEKENDEMPGYMKLMHDLDFKERQHNSLIEKKAELSIINAGSASSLVILSKPGYIKK